MSVAIARQGGRVFWAWIVRRRRFAGMCFLAVLFAGLQSPGHGAGLDCPDINVSGLFSDAQIGPLFYSTDPIDVANELDYLIDKLRGEKPGISYADLTDSLIAAYCPVVTKLNIAMSEKWRRMWQFDTILQQQLAAKAPEPAVVVRVPLSPAAYGELRRQAASVGQTPAQLMAAILSRAAGIQQ